MGDADFLASEVERSISSADLHATCDTCQMPIAGRRRKIRRRRFCSPRCRAMWHRERRAALQAEAAELLRRTAAIVAELAGSRR